MNTRAGSEINKRLERGDFLCLIAGLAQQPIANAVGESKCICVEYGVGYYGVFSKFRVFESYTHQSAVYASCKPFDPDGALYDAVIPNSYDPEDFPFVLKLRDNSLLYLARVLRRKGILTAVAVAQAAQVPLIVAGQGVVEFGPNYLRNEEGILIEHGGFVEYVGSVQPAQRAILLGKVRALIQPTVFMEPFGGNVVEAQFCGTPAITTDYAAFSETVRHGINGYRCHTLEQFVWAVDAVKDLKSGMIHHIADSNYSIWRVRDMYQEYFDQLHDLWDAGWPTLRPRRQLDWLVKQQ
jgi:glycosyltransferase involved in cell wall biosynthesis